MVKAHFICLRHGGDGVLCPGPPNLEAGGEAVSTDPTALRGLSVSRRAQGRLTGSRRPRVTLVWHCSPHGHV